jgi:hypothetical protein
MRFSVYTGGSVSNGVVYANSSFIDNSTGCSHSNYSIQTTISSPSGRVATASAGGSQVSTHLDVSGEFGHYRIVTTERLYCSCGMAYLTPSGGQTIEVPLPGGLKSIPPDTTTYQGLGAYAHSRIWQVYLLDGTTRWQYVAPVTESFSPAPGGCNLTILTATTKTNSVGRFTDCYGSLCLNLPPIPACAVDPNCSTSKTQTISVMGVPFSHTVTFRCTGVSISRP